MTDRPVDFRTTRDWLGRALFVVFGIGIGVAVSVAVVERPDEVTEELVAVDGGSGPVGDGSTGDAEGTAEGGGTQRRVIRGSGTAAGGGGGGGGQDGSVAGGDDGSGGGDTAAVQNPANYECAPGRNGGATDVGVTDNLIRVAANIVTDGAGASFLGEAVIGIEAVLDEVNVTGICGRKIELVTKNDKWDKNIGEKNIKTYIAEDFFALLVNPSSEGLDQAINNNVILDAGIPVVGSDGMLESQYKPTPGKAEWVWPVAASTISTAHIMVKHAAEQGATSFGLVYDEFYKFGQEGAEAFENAFERLEAEYGLESLTLQPVDPNNSQEFPSLIDSFNSECTSSGTPTCDFVGFLLEPSTALQWISNGGTFGRRITAGPQTLFNRDFADNCVQARKDRGEECDMIVWTGYNPPVADLANLPDVAKFVADVQARNGQADIENAFTQGAYLGARLFVAALEEVGPNVTRENLREVLNRIQFSTDLTDKTLSWGEDDHFANTRMHAFEIRQSDSGFSGWGELKSVGWIDDPWPGQR